MKVKWLKNFLLLAYLLAAQVSAALEPDLEGFEARAEKVILKFSGQSLEPQKIEFNKLESSVFFVNNSTDSAVHLAIDFNGKGLHCHSANLKLEEDGYLRTLKPIQPRDFAVLCFPLEGTYSFSVTESAGAKRKFGGEVVVNE